MGKFSRSPAKSPTSPVKTKSSTPTTTTAQGGPGFERKPKSELFLLAISNLVGEDSFYEDAKGRDTRYRDLVRKLAVKDPEWTAGLIKWLRSEANLRSASIVAAIEYGRAMSKADHPFGADYLQSLTPRAVLGTAILRPDEPAEALGYWLSTYGRPLPKWLKRALGDAAIRHYNEFTTLKYDGQSNLIRFGDVLEFSQIDHPHFKNELFKHLLDRRHGHGDSGEYLGLRMLELNRGYQKMDRATARSLLLGDPSRLEAAGMTWESLSGFGPMDKEAWEAVIPLMGYMALLRNLRNFDQAGVSDAVAAQVISKLIDPEEVARSRQLPMRFLSAYNAAPSDRWKYALGIALDLSLSNITPLSGDSAVLIDTSFSMNDSFSKDGSLKRWDAAALFGIAFARVNMLNLVYSFSDRVIPFRIDTNKSVLRMLEEFRRTHFQGSGTQTTESVRTVLSQRPNAKRVLVLTDEQNSGGFFGGHSRGSVDSVVPKDMPLYTFNLAGYRAGHAPAGDDNRHTFGGLSDSGFKMMSLIESSHSAQWPWQS